MGLYHLGILLLAMVGAYALLLAVVIGALRWLAGWKLTRAVVRRSLGIR